jgi:hypothetical protein
MRLVSTRYRRRHRGITAAITTTTTTTDNNNHHHNNTSYESYSDDDGDDGDENDDNDGDDNDGDDNDGGGGDDDSTVRTPCGECPRGRALQVPPGGRPSAARARCRGKALHHHPRCRNQLLTLPLPPLLLLPPPLQSAERVWYCRLLCRGRTATKKKMTTTTTC